MLFLNKLEISYFADFFVRIFKPRVQYDFLQNLPAEDTVNCLEQKTRVFCHIDVQDFHLRIQIRWISSLNWDSALHTDEQLRPVF